MPPEEIIIADSSPLIGLARIAMLPLLPKLARRIVVPPAVRLEITEAKQEAPGAKDVADQSWIETLTPDPAIVAPLRILVGLGEAEAIALAQREPASVLLLDDLRARRLAARLNLRRMGTVALLAAAKRAGNGSGPPSGRVAGERGAWIVPSQGRYRSYSAPCGGCSGYTPRRGSSPSGGSGIPCTVEVPQ